MTEPLLPADWKCRPVMLSPAGLLLEFHPDSNLAFDQLSECILAELVKQYGLIVFRGLPPIPEKTAFSDSCGRFGDLLEWSFGTVFEVVEHSEPGNYLFTSGSVPWHWDGAFAAQVPWLQCFQCREAPLEDAGGETLFCDTNAAWNSLSPETQDRWREIRIEYFTDKVAHYGGTIESPLISQHPLTGRTTIRFAEPANSTTVPLNTPTLRVHGLSAAATETLVEELRRTLYDPALVYAHRWVQGDFLIADNHLLLHGRSPYQQGQPRRLWRVHVVSPAEHLR
ncbi:MAG: TauD/TfdA family dioxygenase [Planctomyces sp.]|nr:TauD/TfdA family dioxygenase [Planctomyces sp.]